MRAGRLIPGVLFLIVGAILIVVAALHSFNGGSLVALIYGIPIFIVGIVILLNKKEDYIEPVKGGRNG